MSYTGTFGYAYDISFLAHLIYGLEIIISVFEKFACGNKIVFNQSLSKLICLMLTLIQLHP